MYNLYHHGVTASLQPAAGLRATGGDSELNTDVQSYSGSRPTLMRAGRRIHGRSTEGAAACVQNGQMLQKASQQRELKVKWGAERWKEMKRI